VAPYLHPHVCFECRKSFKRSADVRQSRPCPICAGPTHPMNRKFKAPRQDETKAWQIVRLLFDHGFRFASVVDETGARVQYPTTLAEAKEFVRSHGRFASARLLVEDTPLKRASVSRTRVGSRRLRRKAG